jgi:tRNA nucleotidyltransferase (CCA-adding enzyme)
MLRAIQFSSRLGFAIEPETFGWIKTHGALIAHMSPERHAEELVKLLMRSPQPSRGLNLLADTNTLAHVLPEVGEGIGVVQNRFHSHDVFGHVVAALDVAAQSGGDLTDRFAALLHDVGKPRTAAPRMDGAGNTFYGHESVGADMVGPMLGRLRFSNEMVADVSNLVGMHMYATVASNGMRLSDATIRRFIRNVSRETDDRDLARARVERQFALRYCDRAGSGRSMEATRAENADFEARVRHEMDLAPALTTSQLDINGRDVMAIAIESGARPANYRGDRLVGETLRALLDVVTDDPCMNERARLLDATRKLLPRRRIEMKGPSLSI